MHSTLTGGVVLSPAGVRMLAWGESSPLSELPLLVTESLRATCCHIKQYLGSSSPRTWDGRYCRRHRRLSISSRRLASKSRYKSMVTCIAEEGVEGIVAGAEMLGRLLEDAAAEGVDLPHLLRGVHRAYGDESKELLLETRSEKKSAEPFRGLLEVSPIIGFFAIAIIIIIRQRQLYIQLIRRQHLLAVHVTN